MDERGVVLTDWNLSLGISRTGFERTDPNASPDFSRV
jgi:hypothetical protein